MTERRRRNGEESDEGPVSSLINPPGPDRADRKTSLLGEGKQADALLILSALAQETRLEAFRLLSVCGEAGMGAGAIARALSIPHNTLSTHLAILQRAGLIRSERAGRKVTYFMVPSSLGALISFLLENCCDAMPEKCLPPDVRGPGAG